MSYNEWVVLAKRLLNSNMCTYYSQSSTTCRKHHFNQDRTMPPEELQMFCHDWKWEISSYQYFKIKQAPRPCSSYNIIYVSAKCKLFPSPFCYIGRTVITLHERVTEHRANLTIYKARRYILLLYSYRFKAGVD